MHTHTHIQMRIGSFPVPHNECHVMERETNFVTIGPTVIHTDNWSINFVCVFGSHYMTLFCL